MTRNGVLTVASGAMLGLLAVDLLAHGTLERQDMALILGLLLVGAFLGAVFAAVIYHCVKWSP